jgi:predicted dehydrogenase
MTRRQMLFGVPLLARAATTSVRFAWIGTGNRGTSLLNMALRLDAVDVTAVCDLDAAKTARAVDRVQTVRNRKPVAVSGGADEYKRVLERNDVDAVVIATPMQDHARMAIDALDAGKHVISEVPAALTVDECWQLVRAARRSRARYLFAENVCYYQSNMAVLNMVKQGLFGELTYAECGYVHDTRYLQFTADGQLTWRGERLNYPGNRYPTHAIGPVSQWLGIHQGDRFVSLSSQSSRSAGLAEYVRRKFGAGSPLLKTPGAGDSNVSLLSTAKGCLVELRYDVSSPRPHPSTTYHNLQGSKASYRDEENRQEIWVDGRSRKVEWEPFEPYLNEFNHPLWRQNVGGGETMHRGADQLMLTDFAHALRDNRQPPIDVYDAVAWSAIIELSARSVLAGGAPQEFPNFAGA